MAPYIRLMLKLTAEDMDERTVAIIEKHLR